MLNESMWFALWAGVALKSTIVLLLAWLIAFALRRGTAALRHLVWTAAAIALLAIPLFSISMPAFEIPSFDREVVAFFGTTATPIADVPVSRVREQPVMVRPQNPVRRRIDWRFALLAIWAAGAVAALAQIFAALAAMSRVRRTANPSPDRELAKRLARELGISEAVEVFGTSDGFMPMTCGIVHPAIFMPGDAAGWSEDRRRLVLLHELAHVRRADVATHLAARLALVLNWWNPLAWIAWSEFLKERERAADDLVLHTGARASEYASHLLNVARGMQSPPALAWTTVAMARRSQLETRLAAILDPQVKRKASGRASALAAALVAIAMAAPFAALRAQDQKSSPVLADIDATIRAAKAQKNYEMLEKPAETFESLRQYDNAQKLLDAALAIRADVAGDQSAEYGIGLTKLADLQKKQGRFNQAQELYAKAAQVLGNRPEASSALIYLGVAKMRDKNYPDAMDYFQKAQALDPAQAGSAQMWMALVREREQNPAAAETLYRGALAAAGPNSDKEATTLELYARLLNDQGRADEAKSMSDRASDIRRAIGAQQPKSTALHIGAGITGPQLLSKVEPEYTEEARLAKYQGTVVLNVEISPGGVAQNIHVVRGVGLGLSENAVAAVSQWRFQPAVKDGAAVTVQATIEVNFRLL